MVACYEFGGAGVSMMNKRRLRLLRGGKAFPPVGALSFVRKLTTDKSPTHPLLRGTPPQRPRHNKTPIRRRRPLFFGLRPEKRGRGCFATKYNSDERFYHGGNRRIYLAIYQDVKRVSDGTFNEGIFRE